MNEFEHKILTYCFNGNALELQRLLTTNPDLTTLWLDETDDLRTPYHIACEQGQVEIVKVLLKDKRFDVNQGHTFGVTPLHYACYLSRMEIVELLLKEEQVNINQGDGRGRTPFYFACQFGNVDIVNHFLASHKVVNFTIKDEEGKSPIDAAREGEKKEKSNWIREQDFQKQKRDYQNIIQVLESYERDPNETRTKLRIKLGFAGKFHSFIYYYFFFE